MSRTAISKNLDYYKAQLYRPTYIMPPHHEKSKQCFSSALQNHTSALQNHNNKKAPSLGIIRPPLPAFAAIDVASVRFWVEQIDTLNRVGLECQTYIQFSNRSSSYAVSFGSTRDLPKG